MRHMSKRVLHGCSGSAGLRLTWRGSKGLSWTFKAERDLLQPDALLPPNPFGLDIIPTFLPTAG